MVHKCYKTQNEKKTYKVVFYRPEDYVVRNGEGMIYLTGTTAQCVNLSPALINSICHTSAQSKVQTIKMEH